MNARKKNKGKSGNETAANLGHEAELWQMADALRGNMDVAEYNHVVVSLIFLKYISDAFEEQRTKLEAEKGEGTDPGDPDAYRAQNIFWVPPEARWAHLKAKQPTIGKLVDDAMVGIERDNPMLKGVLPKDNARPAHVSGSGNGNNGGKAPKRSLSDISIYGQESNYTTWRLAHMNLAIRGIEAILGLRSHLAPDSQTLSEDAKKSESPRWR